MIGIYEDSDSPLPGKRNSGSRPTIARTVAFSSQRRGRAGRIDAAARPRRNAAVLRRAHFGETMQRWLVPQRSLPRLRGRVRVGAHTGTDRRHG